MTESDHFRNLPEAAAVVRVRAGDSDGFIVGVAVKLIMGLVVDLINVIIDDLDDGSNIDIIAMGSVFVSISHTNHAQIISL